jgi:hypothetical protein
MTTTTDIEFVKVIKPNDVFGENLFFNIKANIDLSEYGFKSPAGTEYLFKDIFAEELEKGKNLNANVNDIIRIFTLSHESDIYSYKNGQKEFVGSIGNGDTVGNKFPAVFEI